MWADDSNKGGNDRHAVGFHAWNNETEKPECLILGYSLVSSGSGKDQAEADFHVINKQFGITNLGAMVGDNAKTQTGHIKGLEKQNSELFQKQMFIVGCCPHILNITVRRSCQAAFGSEGDMNHAHICQLHYIELVGYIMKDQIFTRICMLSSVFLTSHPHYLKCGSEQDRSIFTRILSGVINMDQPAYPLHAKLCQDYLLLTPILLSGSK